MSKQKLKIVYVPTKKCTTDYVVYKNLGTADLKAFNVKEQQSITFTPEEYNKHIQDVTKDALDTAAEKGWAFYEKEEPKQETLEEAAFESSVDYKPFEDDLEPQKYYQYGFEKGAKWQQEKMYNEEEVYNLLLKHQSDYRSNVRNSSPINWSFDIKEWFEQLKKK